jgi:hypothetical protein
MNSGLERKLTGLRNITSSKKKSRKESKYSHISPELVIGLLNEGLRLPQIAAVYGCSPQTISYQMKTHDPSFDARKHIRWGRFDITIESVVELFSQTKSSTRIAKAFGVNTQAITQRLEKAGVKRRTLYREDIKTDRVVALYNVIRNTTRIAQLMNTDNATIRRRLNEGGITNEMICEQAKKNRIRRRSDIPTDEVSRLYANNWSLNALGKKYNASFSTIRKILLREGYKIRRN